MYVISFEDTRCHILQFIIYCLTEVTGEILLLYSGMA